MFRELASDEKAFVTTGELQMNANGRSSNDQETENLKRTLSDVRRVEVFSIRTEKKIIPGRQVVIYVSCKICTNF